MPRDAPTSRSVWRVGRKVGRTIYAQLEGHAPSDSDPVIGMMDTPELAREVVDAVNASLTDVERERVLWWLHKPAPPGPMKTLDEQIIRKLNGGAS